MNGGYSMTHDVGYGPFNHGETDIEILYSSNSIVVLSVGGAICVGTPGRHMELVTIPIDGGETEDVLTKDNILRMSTEHRRVIPGNRVDPVLPVDQFFEAINEAIPELPLESKKCRGSEYKEIKDILRSYFHNELADAQGAAVEREVRSEWDYCLKAYRERYSDGCDFSDPEFKKFVHHLAQDCYFMDWEEITESLKDFTDGPYCRY